MSDDQKLNIATYFIMSSPAGEVDEVVNDVRKLVKEDVLSESALSSILKDYNLEQMTTAAAPSSSSSSSALLVSKFGQVADDLFLDPNSGKVLQFDHQKRKFVEETDKRQVLNENVEKLRSALQKELETYRDEQFKAGKCVVLVYGSDSGVLTVCLSAKNVNLSNFWTGNWRSVYSVTLPSSFSSSSSAFSSSLSLSVKGSVKTNVHYFEDGNVQLNGQIELKEGSLSASNGEEAAKKVAEKIAKFETDYQNNLEEMYVNMHQSTFKAMRRFLPVSRQKFNWTTAAHSLASEVSK